MSKEWSALAVMEHKSQGSSQEDLSLLSKSFEPQIRQSLKLLKYELKPSLPQPSEVIRQILHKILAKNEFIKTMDPPKIKTCHA